MSGSRSRVKWSQAHREDMAKIEKVGAAVAFVVGAVLVQVAASRLVEWSGVGLIVLGAWAFFPSARPLISNVVDRLPFLASKTEDR